MTPQEEQKSTRVKTVRPFRYAAGGLPIAVKQPGDEFDMPLIDAKLHGAHGKVCSPSDKTVVIEDRAKSKRAAKEMRDENNKLMLALLAKPGKN